MPRNWPRNSNNNKLRLITSTLSADAIFILPLDRPQRRTKLRTAALYREVYLVVTKSFNAIFFPYLRHFCILFRTCITNIILFLIALSKPTQFSSCLLEKCNYFHNFSDFSIHQMISCWSWNLMIFKKKISKKNHNFNYGFWGIMRIKRSK